MCDDAELLRRFSAQADAAAFAHFVHRHSGYVLASAVRRFGGDEHRARDVAQRVFILAARHARALARHPNVCGWLFTTTRNQALNLMRDEQRRERREREAAALSAFESAPPVREDPWHEIGPQLDTAMDRLGESDRQALLLRFFRGLPLAEVGHELGVTENAARMRVQRALDRLNGLLARSGVIATSGGLGTALSAHASVAVVANVSSALATSAISASSVVTAGSLGTLLGFMSASKIVTGVGALAALVVGLSVLWQSARARATYDEVQVAREEERRRAGRVANLRARATAAEADRQGAEAELRERTAELAAASKQQTTPAAALDPAAEGAAFLARHPKVKLAFEADTAARIRYQYEPLFTELALTETEIAEFLRLRSINSGFSRQLSDGRILDFRGPRVPHAEVDAALKALLKPERFDRFVAYSLNLPQREYAAQVASALVFTDTPLAVMQAGQLMEAIGRHKQPVRGAPPRIDWDGVRTEAAAFMQPAQLEVLDGFEAKQAAQQKWRERSQPANLPPRASSGGKS